MASNQIYHSTKAQHYVSLIILTILLSCSGKPGNESAIEQGTNSELKKIKLKDLNDQPLDLSQYRGKVIFLNFWATWCRPCIEEMPSIEKAQVILKGKNIEFVLASNEEVQRIQSFIKSRSLKMSYVQLENMEELNIPALPTSYIFDTYGKLVFSETGYRQWDAPENIELITKIINEHE